MGRERPAKASRHVAKYLARNESVALEMKQHWARIVPAALCCLTGLVLVIVGGLLAPASIGFLTNAAWWIWLVLVGHLLWRILEWRDEVFVITNHRLVLVHGMVVKKVAMMPLSKVTDMSYNRSVPGRLLGYGTYVMESAGQDQALSTVHYVRDPDAIYRQLTGLIFGEKHSDDWDETESPQGTDEFDGQDGSWEEVDTVDGVYDHSREPWEQRPLRAVDDTDPFGLIIRSDRPSARREEQPSPTRPTSQPTRPIRQHPVPPRQEETDDWDDDTDAWTVSREHATAPQSVRRAHHSD